MYWSLIWTVAVPQCILFCFFFLIFVGLCYKQEAFVAFVIFLTLGAIFCTIWYNTTEMLPHQYTLIKEKALKDPYIKYEISKILKERDILVSGDADNIIDNAKALKYEAEKRAEREKEFVVIKELIKNDN